MPSVAPTFGPRISIKTGAATQQQQAASNSPAPQAAAKAREEDAYTDAALQVAWTACATMNPAAVALNNILKSYHPRRANGDRFIVCVSSEAQQKILTDSLPSVHDFIRRRLHNDNILFAVELADGGNSPAVWTETQVLDHLLKENPALRYFAETFSATIS